MKTTLPLLVTSLASVFARRRLHPTDLHYDLEAFTTRFNSRVNHVFGGAAEHFHRRLFEHESLLPDDRLQTYLANLHPAHGASAELSTSLEKRADGLTIHTVVGGDLMLHGTREHADMLREQPEVRTVVPLLPELKVTPHFEALLPQNNHSDRSATVSLNVRLVPLERHEHMRRPSAVLVGELGRALSSPCEARPEWARPPVAVCDVSTRRSSATVRVEAERTLVVERLSRAESLAVAHVVALLPEALWVEPHAEYRALNADAVAITQSGSPTLGTNAQPRGTKPIHAMGLHGEDEVIGVGDSGLDTGHCFFENALGDTPTGQAYGPTHRKVVAYRAYADGAAVGQQDHGTHVIGSILGESSAAGGTNELHQGSAYKAKVSFTDIGPGNQPGLAVPNDLVNNFFNVDYDNGARIHSNSWGANINAYSLSTADVDEFMHKFDDMLILYAAGNSGDDGPASIGAPATCKNCLTVGASENQQPLRGRFDGNVATFSSIGPAVGGRYKPDVVAPGFFVLSANSNAETAASGPCPIVPLAGTSMATPITAGDVALVRQYLREGYFPGGTKGSGPSVVPSGALMKAMVIHSGEDLAKCAGTAAACSYRGQTIADYTPPPAQNPNNLKLDARHIAGFGRVQLNKILFGPNGGGRSPSQRLFFADGNRGPLATGQEHTYDIPIASEAITDPELGTEFKVTLVWTDAPAQPLDNTPLMNNLDLEVSVNGQLPASLGNGELDRTNTVEQVTLTSVPPGATVQVKVKGTAVTQGPQRYALVVTGPTDANPLEPVTRPGQTPPGGTSAAQAASSGDAAALGVTLPLLFIAIGAGGCFFFRRSPGGAGRGGAGAKAALPPGWRQLSDPRSGAPYYLNEDTGATQWEPPAVNKSGGGVPPPPPPPELAPPSLPDPWTAVVDPGSGRTYYYNSKTGETQWTMPQ